MYHVQLNNVTGCLETLMEPKMQGTLQDLFSIIMVI